MSTPFRLRPFAVRAALDGAGAFLRDRGGAFVMQFALMATPLVISVGLAIDGGRAFLARYELQQAIDAAALAVGSTTAEDDALLALADRYVRQNFRMSHVSDLEVDPPVDVDGVITLTARVNLNTYFMPIVGKDVVPIAVQSEVRRGGANVEVALVLDTTGSMSGSRITALKTAANTLINTVVQDDQTVYFSKVAIVPYANGVPVGGYADAVRGVPGPDAAVTGVEYLGAGLTITNVTKANQAVFTSAGHGLVNNDVVYLQGLNAPYTSLNDVLYKVKSATTNTFKLRRYDTNAWANTNSLGNYGGGGEVRPCLNSDCEVRITAEDHGLAEDEYIYLVDVEGMTDLNTDAFDPWQAVSVTEDTFFLEGSYGPDYDAYTTGGVVKCLRYGCEYMRYSTAGGGTRTQPAATCVTERTGAEAYTDAAPDAAPVAFNYPGTGTSACFTDNTIIPLSSDKDMLTTEINALTTGGYTSGHIGMAWGWYMLSPNWGYLWPAAENAATAYDDETVMKVAVLMTDGEFNTAHCNGVSAKDSTGSSSERINCNATNGDEFDQARSLCTAMQDAGLTIFSVGVELGSSSEAADVLEDCATDPSYFYETDTDDLEEAFASIAQAITKLRISR